MSRNLEIKAVIHSPAHTRKLAEKFCEGKNFELYKQSQEDIYYVVKKGRLKLRIINGKTGNLIHYFRSNKTRQRISDYTISETETPEKLKRILNSLFQKLITVKKRREIFIVENIRIHLDKVESLGNFLEFEIIIKSEKQAEAVMRKLITHFELDEKQFIKVSYSDLLLNKK